MGYKKITGTGIIANTDYHAVKWVGKTKNGNAIQIEFEKAINLGNMEFQYADKDDVVTECVFTAVYTELATETEPWCIKYADDFTNPQDEIMLGAGKLYIDNTAVALTRGGGKFAREVEFREIEYDGQRGPTEDMVVMDGVRVSLTMSALQILTKISTLYAGLQETTITSMDETEGQA